MKSSNVQLKLNQGDIIEYYKKKSQNKCDCEKNCKYLLVILVSDKYILNTLEKVRI